MDFLLKRERVVVEIKKVRRGLNDQEVGKQLIVDCQKYKGHPDYGTLVCFIYDPEALLKNPRGLERDLATAGGELPVVAYIRPV